MCKILELLSIIPMSLLELIIERLFFSTLTVVLLSVAPIYFCPFACYDHGYTLTCFFKGV